MTLFPRSTTRWMVLAALAFSVTLPGCDRFRNFTDQEHVQRAKDLLAKNDLRASEIELKNAISKNPKNAEARWLLGDVYLESDQGASAEKEFKRALELGVSAESLKVPLGRAYAEQGKYKELLQEIDLGPQTATRAHAHILKLRGDAFMATRKGKEGCELYVQSNQIDKDFVEAYWGLSRCAVGRQDTKAARAQLEQALSIDRNNYGTWAVLGDLERSQGHQKEAEQNYLAALKLKPKHVPSRLKLVQVYLAQNKLDAATKEVGALRKEAPRNTQARYLEALVSYQQGKYPVAREQLQGLLRQQPNHLAGVLLFGSVSLALGDDEQASQAFDRFLGVVPGHIHARKLAATTALKRSEPRRALEWVNPILKQRPNDGEAMALAAEAYMQLREPEKASDWYEKAVAAKPDNAKLRTELALSRLSSGESDQAIEDLTSIIQASPTASKADTALASVYLQKKQFDQALQVIANLEKKLPKNPDVLNLKAAAYVGKGDMVQARKALTQALELRPDYTPAAVNLARLEMQDKKPDAARKHLEGILKKNSDSLSGMLALAEFERSQNQEAAAYVSLLNRAVKAHPKALAPQMELVQHQLAKGEARQALVLARGMTTTFPNSREVQELLAQTQLAAGERENAVASYQKLVEEAPERISAQFGLANAQLAKGDAKAARIALASTLKLEPRHIGAQSMLFGIELREKKYAEALRLAKAAQSQYPQAPFGHVMEGDVQIVQGQYAAATRAYEQAFAITPTGLMLSRVHGAATAAGQEQAATTRLKKWIQDHPGDTEVRAYYAAFLVRKEQDKEAIIQYEALLKHTPNHVLALNNLANLHQRNGDKRALEIAERASKLAPQNPTVQDTLGWILVEQGQAKRAEPLLAKSVAAQPSPTGHYHWAVALAQTGSRERAAGELKRLLATNQKFPESEQAKALLGQLQR